MSLAAILIAIEKAARPTNLIWDRGLRLEVRVNPVDSAEMVWIPAGTFLMGTTPAESDLLMRIHRADVTPFRFDRETPQHKVYLDGFWMYRTLVTVGQYEKFCSATAHSMPLYPDLNTNAAQRGWLDDHPMQYVTWYDAQAYCKWAGASLPTEAEWEKADRGTSGQEYPWGNNLPTENIGTPRSAMDAMGSFPVMTNPQWRSPFGIDDMFGPVIQWCSDWYDADYYRKSPSRNPTGPGAGPSYEWGPEGLMPFRCQRGRNCGFYDTTFKRYARTNPRHDPAIVFALSPKARWAWETARCANRGYAPPAWKGIGTGFRCVMRP